MNLALHSREVAARTDTLSLFALFHLNLAFSSIEEEARGAVIEKCYWPLLRLAEAHGPLGIEATGFTLEEIATRDSAWIAKARQLIAQGRVELIGSGYAQLIAPLVPWRVTQANLAIGHEIYAQLLGVRPAIALVNEQAYAGGLVGLYRDAGYRALLMDWDNPGAHNPQWPAETRYRPQIARGSDGSKIELLWTNTVAFQKLQRLAHGDIALGDYLDYVRGQHGESARLLCVYASDGEVFDFRPGRYATEAGIEGPSEWSRIAEAFVALQDEEGCDWIAPSRALDRGPRDGTRDRVGLKLETPACPVPVKKQRKYNLSRWAVTGRDNTAINAACERIYRGLMAGEHRLGEMGTDSPSCRATSEENWKELCYLWSSDFRTHITEKRWLEFCARLKAAENEWGRGAPAPLAPPPTTPVVARHIDIETPALLARLDRRRGLAIERLAFGGRALAGGLVHGHFDDIAFQADWYTGDCVFEAPGEHKITDLEWCEARLAHESNGDRLAFARIETPKGPVEKTLRFHAAAPRVDFDLAFHWPGWGKGSLRLGHVTLLPHAFDWNALVLTTHNGGREPERFALAGHATDHGAPVSFLVSSSHGLGMTEGWAEIGDGKTGLRIEVDRATAPLLGMLTHRVVGRSLFCQLQLSALELDDTRKPLAYETGPRRFRFSIAALPETV